MKALGNSSRRCFLQQVSAAAAVGLLAQMPDRRLWARSAAELFPEPDEVLLRDLALKAVEAARSAGAGFADIRMVAGCSITIGGNVDYRQSRGPEIRWPDVTSLTSYGIRAIVDGAWGFAGGTELTPDAMRDVARRAVARARTNRPRRPRTLALAPVPQGDHGTWATPIKRDPFQVPVGEQADVLLAALAEAGRVRGVHNASAGVVWNRNLRVFASSEGALITQRMWLARPKAGASVDGTSPESHGASDYVPALRNGPYGYEALARVNLNEELRHAGERAVIESRRSMPVRSAEVGRYDIVFGAPAVASLLVTTLAEAVNLERALGYQANNSGTSFAAPPADILGQYKVGAPLLTLRADRTRPGRAATVGWDDEGVRPRECTLVREGVIVDYLTNRQTAPELAGWYGAQGETVRSHGFASGGGQAVPTIRLPNLTMEAGREERSVEDLIADTKKGFYIQQGGGFSDQQVLNTQGATLTRFVREIQNGKLRDWVRDLAFQFITPTFWRRVDAIGGPSSSVEILQSTGLNPNDPLQLPLATVAAVPARVREVNVLNTGRTV